jgi:hypothetical protein
LRSILILILILMLMLILMHLFARELRRSLTEASVDRKSVKGALMQRG